MSENSECIADLYISQGSRFTSLLCASSVGPVQAESVQLAVVGMCHIPALCGGDIVWELSPGAADRNSGAVVSDARAPQFDIQRKVKKKKKVTYYKIYTRDKYKYVNEINESVLLLQAIVLFTSDKINITFWISRHPDSRFL